MKDNIIQFPTKKNHECHEKEDHSCPSCLNAKTAKEFLLASDGHIACFVISLDENGDLYVGGSGDHYKLFEAFAGGDMFYNNDNDNDNAS